MEGDIRLINELAGRQFGVFNSSQARGARFSRGSIRRRIQNGNWIQLAPTVYAVAAAPPTWERQMSASILSRPRAYVAEKSAAYLHGIRGVEKARPVIVVPETSNARSDICRVIRHRRFDDLSVRWVGGFQAISVSEAIVLLSRRISTKALESVFDESLLAGKLDLSEIERILERESSSRVGGLRNIEELLASRGPSAPTVKGSYLESLLETLLRTAGITGWVREFGFSIRGHDGRVDFFFEAHRVVLEADGRSWHLRYQQSEEDRRRDNDLAGQGCQVLRFTYRALTEEPDVCIATLQRVLKLRAPVPSA
jgi:very-short-patch-repair endonuclease